MAVSLEHTILQLLTPNNASLSQGFSAMREAFKDPGINIGLCECMATTQLPQVRQYCAVLLRKKITKAKQWKRIPEQEKQGLKQTILELFLKETEQTVLNAVAELIATIAKHELHQKKWPELMQLLNHCMQSSNTKEKELGLYAMSVITASAGQNLKLHLKGLLSVFSKTLMDTSSILIPFYTIECLTNLVNYIGTEEMNLLQNLVPLVLQVIKNLATADEEKACKAMEIFDALVESEVAVIVPHIKPLIGFCLELAGSQNLEPNIRVKALHIISWLTRLKKKTILKHKLISPILDVLFPLMCQSVPGVNDEPIDDNDSDDDDDLSPSSMAGQVIDTMALHLPPEKLIPPLMHHMDTALKSDDPQHRKAAYLALAVIAEGCSEHIRNKCLPNYLQVICKGIREENPLVKNAALYCLGQFAEHLQPDISKYASELLPVLLDYLQQTCQVLKEDDKNPPSLTKTFYALETFCENLGDELLPYLPTLMERLLTFLTTTKSVMTKELAISAIGSVASSAKESFVPYFSSVIDNLKVFISEKTKENMPLKIQAIDTLSIIAGAVGPEVFMPMAHNCMVLGLELVDEVDDPDLRRCIYNLFAAVSSVLKTEMVLYLDTVVEHMISSILSCEGINAQYTLEQNSSFTLFEDGDDDDEEEDLEDEDDEANEEDDDDVAGFSVENAYMDEKEAACSALREISANIGIAFLTYLNKCFTEVKKLIESPACEVRREAIVCLGQFCISLNQSFLETGSLEYRLELEEKQNSFLPKLFTTAREDTERRVVLVCLETLQEMLGKIKNNFVFNNTLESVVVLIKDVFKHKLACQDDDEDEELDDQEAEYDSMLFEYAGDIIPALVKIVPWQQFAPYFAGLLPFILSKTKRTCSVSDKSFSIGTLAEVVAAMEPGASKPFITHLLPIFLKGMADEDEEVRSNSVYGLGVLVQNAAEALFDQYTALLQALSNMLSKEDNPRARDNLCSTIAKMIMTNIAAIPLKEVFPALLQRLPLQVDMDENIVVYQCLALLHSLRCEEFFQNLPEVLRVLSIVLSTQKIDDATGMVITQLLQSVHAEFPLDFETVVKNLPSNGADALRTAVMLPLENRS